MYVNYPSFDICSLFIQIMLLNAIKSIFCNTHVLCLCSLVSLLSSSEQTIGVFRTAICRPPS